MLLRKEDVLRQARARARVRVIRVRVSVRVRLLFSHGHNPTPLPLTPRPSQAQCSLHQCVRLCLKATPEHELPKGGHPEAGSPKAGHPTAGSPKGGQPKAEGSHPAGISSGPLSELDAEEAAEVRTLHKPLCPQTLPLTPSLTRTLSVSPSRCAPPSVSRWTAGRRLRGRVGRGSCSRGAAPTRRSSRCRPRSQHRDMARGILGAQW